jgi:predicted GNAT family acetyltransferase
LTIPEFRGNGFAGELVQRALDDVRTRGRKVEATCWYVNDFINDHAEYADLRA